MNIDDIKNSKLQEKLRGAESTEDILAVIQEEGVELTDEQLDGIAGGSWYDTGGSSTPTCPWCGSSDVTHLGANSRGNPKGGDSWQCNSCDSIFDC